MPVQTPELPKRIVIKGDEAEWHEEYPAAAGLTPGHLLEITSAGTCQRASSAVIKRSMFAKEDPLLRGATIDTAYVANDIVPCHMAQTGDMVYGFVPAAAVAIVSGDPLKSNGDGTVVKSLAATDQLIGDAEAAVDNSAGATPARIKIRVR
jgi:hypothetical protein